MAAESQGCEPDYQLPYLGEAEYFISMLSEIGEARPSGSGIVSLSWEEIRAWIDVTGANVSPGDAEALRHLSASYVSQYYKSMEQGCPSPNIETPPNREQVEGKMKSLFAMLRGSNG